MNKKTSKRTRLGFAIFIIAYVIINLGLILYFRDGDVIVLDFVQELAYSVLGLVFALVGGLILVRQSRNRIGWFLMILPTMMTVSRILDFVIGQHITANTDLTLSIHLYAWFSTWSWWLLIAPLFLIFLFFPTGKLLSPRWRWVVGLLAASFGLFVFAVTFYPLVEIEIFSVSWPNPIGFLPLDLAELLVVIMGAGLLTTMLLSVISVFLRYRIAQAAEKAQLRWLFFASSIFLVVYGSLFRLSGESGLVGEILFILAILGIPLAIGVAILRYRLWDIDLVINRSLVYGILTALLAGIFAATASLAAQIAKLYFGGEMNEAAAAVAAIFVASIFNPLRLYVEGVINRRLFPENIDLSQGLVEIDPDVWHWVDLQTILNATLHHLKGIYSFTNAGIYQRTSENEFRPVAALGSSLRELSVLKLSKTEMDLLAAKKGVVDEDGNPFAVMIPIYLARRNSSEILGLVRLGKREKGRGYSGDDIKTLVSFGAKLGKAVFALSSESKSKRWID
jgi:hypothetical protein